MVMEPSWVSNEEVSIDGLLNEYEVVVDVAVDSSVHFSTPCEGAGFSSERMCNATRCFHLRHCYSRGRTAARARRSVRLREFHAVHRTAITRTPVQRGLS